MTLSTELFQKAKTLLPGGVNSPVRAMDAIGREPIFFARGEGAELVDVDGNRYVDYVCSWGPLVHGHAHREVIRAVTAAAERGTSYGAPIAAEVELAREIVDRVPGAEMVRMTSSGTEAVMTAVRLARAVTGRELVIKFAGAYHGHVDGLLVAAGSGVATYAVGVPAGPGILPEQAAATIVIPWNDKEALREAVGSCGSELAAIIAEPIPANMGVVPPESGFLEELRAQASGCGALLIMDEVITGFRVARGGAQEKYGVIGDLTVLGKILGGGLPAAAVAGPRETMERLAPSGDVYQAGTLSGNPLAMAAGVAVLRLLDSAAYEKLESITARLAGGIREAAASADAAVQIVEQCGLMTVFFSEGPVRNYEDASKCDAEAFGVFCRALIERGIYPPPSQFEAWFPSLAHTEAHIARTASAAADAFESVKASGHSSREIVS